MAFNLGGASGLASIIKIDVNDKVAETSLTAKKETNGLFARLNKVTTGVFSSENEEAKPVAGTDAANAETATAADPAKEAKDAEAAKAAADKEAATKRSWALIDAYEAKFGKQPATIFSNGNRIGLSDEAIERRLKEAGVTEEEIAAASSKPVETSWLQKGFSAVGTGVAKANTAIGDAIDFVENADEKITSVVDKAGSFIDDAKASINKLPFVGEALGAFKRNFCAAYPFPACASCEHRQAMTNDRGFDLFRLIADIRSSLQKGLFDLANKLFDCPGMAEAISNGDFGAIKGAVMNNGLNALMQTGVQMGAASVFGGLAGLNPNDKNWANGTGFLNKLVQSHSAAIVKSIRSGDFDLVDGAYKLKDIRVSDFFEVTWGPHPGPKAVGFKGGENRIWPEGHVNNTEPAYKAFKDYKAYEVAAGISDDDYAPSSSSSPSSPIPSAPKYSGPKLPTAQTAMKSGLDTLEKAINEANAKADEEIVKASSAMAKLEEEAMIAASTVINEAKAMHDGGIEVAVDPDEIIPTVDPEKIEEVGKTVSKAAASKVASTATTTMANKPTVISLSGIRTNNAQMPASIMAKFNGNRASLHSLKVAYAADARVFGSKIPVDVKYTKIKTKSDALFARSA